MSAPDVALTDFALAVEAGAMAVLMRRSRAGDRQLRRWWTVLFAAVGVAALAGGVAHGYLEVPRRPAFAVAYDVVVHAVLVATAACWVLGVRASCPPGRWRWAAWGAAVVVALVAWGAGRPASFAGALAVALTGMAPLLLAFVLAEVRAPGAGTLHGVVGLLLVLAAAMLWRAEVAIPALRLGPDAVFHVVQAIALVPLFAGARALTRRSPC